MKAMDCASQASRELALSPVQYQASDPTIHPGLCLSPQTFRMAWSLPVVLRSFELKLAQGLKSPRATPVKGPKEEGGPEKECDLLETTPLGEGRADS